MVGPESFPGDDAALIEAVRSANVPTLMLVMVHLTGDTDWLRGPIKPRRATPQQMDGGLSEADAAAVRERALGVLRAYRDSNRAFLPLPGPAVLAEMMQFSLGQPIAPEYVPMMLDDMALASGGARDVPGGQAVRGASDLHVVVIGAGMSGILAAIALRSAGFACTLVEKNADVGGTWLENSYPGCRVDLPNHFYSYSFEPNYDWPDHYSCRDELLAYFQRVATKYGVRQNARFETEVVAARYDAAQPARWTVTLRDRSGREDTLRAHAVISAVGQLNRPSIPALPGLQRFQGPAFHSARWRHDVDLRDKRVAIVGTGASAMQIVPQLAQEVKRLVIFQRSPQWALAVPEYFRSVSAGERWLLRHVPFYAPWYRFRLFFTNGDGVHAGLHVDPDWHDPRRSLNAGNDRIRRMLTEYIERELGPRQDLRDKCVPDYPPFAKRMLLDNRWFRTLQRENVELVTDAIREVSERGIETDRGALHELDAIVFASGFQANRFLWPMAIEGRDGRSLHAQWGDDPRAYLGITVPGFPNLFCLYGPNTNLAHGGSIIFHSECQVHYVLACLRMLIERGAGAMECKQDVHDAYNARVDAAHARMVWAHPHVSNWYKNSAGRVTTNSPFRLVDYWAMTRTPNADDFVFDPT